MGEVQALKLKEEKAVEKNLKGLKGLENLKGLGNRVSNKGLLLEIL